MRGKNIIKHVNYYRYENKFKVYITSAVHKLNNNKVQVLVQCPSNKKPVVHKRAVILLCTRSQTNDLTRFINNSFYTCKH